ncbi:MAG: PAS domain S-box protein, partial [Myxacorys chilensis ATA2-1-KO14]|nr:PAS domain S-box protein [Myxacorys chilensis ATA2-1-KO14]
MNHLHKFHLVEAEKARVLGQFLEAEELYEQAIAGAAEHEFIQEEALAYELAAKHYLARGREKFAQTYMKEAHHCYERWGATAKVKDLETCYPQFFAQKTASTSTHTTAENASDHSAIATLAQQVAERTAALQKSEANYRNLIQTANSIILRYDPQGRIQYVNDYGLRFLGYEEHELLGHTLLETIVPETEISGRDRKQFIQDLLRNPASYSHAEGENLCRDGRRVWIAWSNQAILDDQGQVVEILSVGNDITQRKQAEEALQHSETKFRAIFENSQVGIFRVRLSDGLLLDANQRHANLFGFDSPEEIIGLEHVTGYYANPSDHQHLIELLKREREVRSFEAQMRKRDGTLFWGLFSLYLNAGDDYTEGVVADISDRKQAEAALRQSEANYRNLLQTANSVIIRYDTQGRIRYINDYGVKLLGYEEHEILGRTVFETIIPEAELSGRDIRPFVHDLLRNPQSYPQTDGENLCRDGRRVWVAWSNQAILDDQGEVVEILSVGNDTTQRRQAEEALQRSETKFRTIFENSQVGIFRTRLSDGLILDANQRFAALFGFDSPEEVIGLKHTTDCYVNPSDRQQAIELLKRDGELQNFEVQLQKRDGTLFWGLHSTRLNAADECIEGVIADISDLKQAEVALQTSEERLRLALTASNQGLYDLDLKTEERIVNPEYALMLGYNPATFHEPISEWIARLHPDDRESVVATYRAYIAGEIPSYQAEYRQRTQDGQWKWTLSVGKIVAWDESGQPMRMLGTHVDISDRKQAEAALQASEAELRALFSAIPDPLCIFTAEGQLICAIEGNPSYGVLDEEEYIGKTLYQLYAKEQADEFLSYIQQVLRTQQVLTVEYSKWIAGREIWFSARIAPIRHEQVIWLARDITLQKRAEAASILEERNRMAREIHDTLAQAFTGILAQVGAANQVLTDDVEATGAHLDLIKELARTGLSEARRSVVALRPQLLEEGSLQSALHRLVAQLRTAAMDTTLYYEIEGAVYFLPTEVESNLLRMGQEALTNAVRHANADEIRVELVYDRDQVCLRVKDNGQGFGVGSIPSSEGFGLLGMSER